MCYFRAFATRRECVLFVIQQCTVCILQYTKRSFTIQRIAWLRTWFFSGYIVRRALRIYKNGWREKKKLSSSTLLRADGLSVFLYSYIGSRISLHKCTGNDYISVSATPRNSLNGTVYGYIARIYLYCGELWDHYTYI